VTLPAQADVVANTHLAVDPCGAYLTGDLQGGGVVMALPLADLQWSGAGGPSAAHLTVLPAVAGVVPAIDEWDGIGSDARMFVARDASAGPTAIDVYKLTWASPTCGATTSATLGAPASVSLGADYLPPTRAAAQPAPAPGLDAGRGAIASAVASSGSIVGISTIELGGQLGAMWFQIYADPSSSYPPVVQQIGTIEDPTADLIAPAIASDPYNGIGVVLVRTSASDPPAVDVTGQALGDPPGSMRPLAQARAGIAAYSCTPTAGVTAFGRYSSIASTATGFWAVAQYGASSASCAFGTAWVNFGAGDDPVPRDDAPRPLGCGGCASRGDGATSLAGIAAVAFALRRRRTRRAR
jgi:hypothetical protein